MKISEVLTASLDLIRDPARHCREALARDAAGSETFPTRPGAVTFCAEGAVIRACGNLVPDYHRAHELEYRCKDRLNAAALALGWHGAANCNDNGTHADVVKVYELAIGVARREEGEQ